MRTVGKRWLYLVVGLGTALILLAAYLFWIGWTVQRSPKARIVAAKAAWHSTGIKNYQMLVSVAVYGNDFGPYPVGLYRIRVKAGQIVQADETNPFSDPKQRVYSAISIDKVAGMTVDGLQDFFLAKQLDNLCN